jgi:hypothetical protein
MIYFIIWFALGIVGASIAKGKGNTGCGGFLLGGFLGPIGLLLTFFASDDEAEMRRRTGDTKICPYCAEYVKEAAIVCKHCGRTLGSDNSDFDIENFRQ